MMAQPADAPSKLTAHTFKATANATEGVLVHVRYTTMEETTMAARNKPMPHSAYFLFGKNLSDMMLFVCSEI